MATRRAGKTANRKSRIAGRTPGELLKLRTEKGLTGGELARRLGTSQATVSKMETGFQKPTMDYVVRFAAGIGLSKAETTDLLMRLNLLPSGVTGDRTAEVLSVDFVSGDYAKRQQNASVVRVFEPHEIPEILQTEEYARSEVRLSGAVDPEAAERLVKARLKWQKDLKEKRRAVVLTEAALRARICSSADMVGQLERIKSFAEAKNCRLGLIPWHARLTVTIPPAFQVYDNALACVGFPHGLVRLTREKDVELYLRLFEALEKMAVVGRESGSVLDRIIEDFKRLENLERAVNSPSV